MSEIVSIRLSKAAKEFNLSIHTLTDFLNEKGFKIGKADPNFKLTPEMHRSLMEKFRADKELKADSGIKIPPKKEQLKPISIDDLPVSEKRHRRNEEELIIKDQSRLDEETEAREVKKESELKVLGKIDLDKFKPPARAGKTVPEQKLPEQPVKEEPAKEKKEVLPGNGKEAATGQEIIRPRIEKIEGPKILGQIEIRKETDQKKWIKEISAQVAKDKKKRKRIKKKKIEKIQGNIVPYIEEKKKERFRKSRRRKSRNEVSQVDVQKQVKETLARLSDSSKSKSVKYRKEKREAIREALQQRLKQQEEEKKIIPVTEFVTASQLASMMDVSVNDVIQACLSIGLMVSINQRLDAETIVIIAEEFGYGIKFVTAEDQLAIEEAEDKKEDMKPRAPIITVMGHVDHGKTKLLDHVRNTNVIAGEAGGITQHIGAYEVKLANGKRITFIDTPGHEAFTAMRARGTKVTDIAIIVVAADDGVMPQTVEAINHAQAAGVPMVFAINKMDKPQANPNRVKEQLAKLNLLVEEWGGRYQCQEISAKAGLNVDLLLEKVIIEADMLDVKSNPVKKASGSVIESTLDRGRGYIATVLVQNGTLRAGDFILAGPHCGKVKAMFNERNQPVMEAGPSTPVIILGLDGAPQAGDKFNILDDERQAKEIAIKRQQLMREQSLRTQKHITLDEIGRRIAMGDFQQLNVIVKGDVDGSVEALADSLLKLSTENIRVNVIHKGVGQITESDVLLASASDAVIIGFQVRPSADARKIAAQEQIDMRLYSVIYDAINHVKDAMEGMLSPEMHEKIVATVEVRDVFKITKVGTVAGSFVSEGKIAKNTKVRVIRDGIVIHSGNLSSVKRFKEDVKEVVSGYECGIAIANYSDLQKGDIIEGYEVTEVKRKLLV
ncbi:MAG: translation initiation factor IF-2 [Bacteroidetes bacterium]|nr:translation initiation factor IF-2 [Bacteroidota bacterium]